MPITQHERLRRLVACHLRLLKAPGSALVVRAITSGQKVDLVHLPLLTGYAHTLIFTSPVIAAPRWPQLTKSGNALREGTVIHRLRNSGSPRSVLSTAAALVTKGQLEPGFLHITAPWP